MYLSADSGGDGSEHVPDSRGSGVRLLFDPHPAAGDGGQPRAGDAVADRLVR